MRSLFTFSLFLILFLTSASFRAGTMANPELSISFDDGNTNDVLSSSNSDWNDMILYHLRKNETQAIFYIAGKGMANERGNEIINEWSKDGHLIGNHSFSHLNFNREEMTVETYREDFLKCDSLIKNTSTFVKYYRFPYLKEGNTIEKRDLFRQFLKEQGYRTGHVTIDASDWYINSRLIQKLKQDKDFDIRKFKDYYIKHILDRAKYYHSLGVKLTQRNIKHTLLLHHNYINALFLGDLLDALKRNGWKVINASESFKDPVYNSTPKTIPAGESLLWSMAKETGKFEEILRYPAESDIYEKEAMDKLGL